MNTLELSNTQEKLSLENSEVVYIDSWKLIQKELLSEYGEETYKSWISKLVFEKCDDHFVNFNVPTRFIRDWIKTHFEKKILKLWQRYIPGVKKIYISVAKTQSVQVVTPLNYNESVVNINSTDNPLVSYQSDKRFSFDNFILGPSNEFAYTAAKAVAEAKKPQPGSNPLFLYGGVGLGKTHLMHSIAWHIMQNDTKKKPRKVMYISAERFMYQFISALRDKKIIQFKEKFRSVDLLMVDDIQFICGKNNTQEEFFHILNTLIESNKQVVISADRSPSDLENMESRIKSRLGWGLVADIHNTTYELRLGILQSKIEPLNANVSHGILEFLASKITSNIRELEGALNKIVAHSKLTGRQITIDTTQDILRDLLRSNDRYITIEEIQKKVSERYNLKISDMYSTKRSRNIARPRQVAMFLSKDLTSKSFAEIGKKFGGKDHSTVMHAIKSIEKLVKENSELADDIRLLTKSLQ